MPLPQDQQNALSLETMIANKCAEILAFQTTKPDAHVGMAATVAWQAYFDGLHKQLAAYMAMRPAVFPFEVQSVG